MTTCFHSTHAGMLSELTPARVLDTGSSGRHDLTQRRWPTTPQTCLSLWIFAGKAQLCGGRISRTWRPLRRRGAFGVRYSEVYAGALDHFVSRGRALEHAQVGLGAARAPLMPATETQNHLQRHPRAVAEARSAIPRVEGGISISGS
jgi:hypothetical protein